MDEDIDIMDSSKSSYGSYMSYKTSLMSSRCSYWIEFEDAWDSQPEVSRQIVERIKLICYNEPRRE
tara:strand:+ start:388 stop:585 length:198 start_codon:yes stop_codon:yes gene_type:complete